MEGSGPSLQGGGDIEGARNHYGVVTKLDPDFVAGWDAWSRLELREGNPVKAALAGKGLSAVGALDAETPPQQSERLWHAYALAPRPAAAVRASIRIKLPRLSCGRLSVSTPSIHI